MNRTENPTEIGILEMMVKNPYNKNIPLEQFCTVIKHFYGFEREEVKAALNILDSFQLVEFIYTPEGDIDTVFEVTEAGFVTADILFLD